MNFSHQLSRRFSVLNRGSATFDPVHVKPDGHGTYMMDAQKGSRHVVQQVYVNAVEAKSLAQGRTNQNLDSQLRL